MLSQEMFTVQDPSSPPSDILLWTPLECLYRTNVRIQDLPQRGDSRPVLSPSEHTLSDHEKLGTTGWSSNWFFVHNKYWRTPVLWICGSLILWRLIGKLTSFLHLQEFNLCNPTPCTITVFIINEKSRGKEKTYIWVSVWWKTKG